MPCVVRLQYVYGLNTAHIQRSEAVLVAITGC